MEYEYEWNRAIFYVKSNWTLMWEISCEWYIIGTSFADDVNVILFITYKTLYDILLVCVAVGVCTTIFRIYQYQFTSLMCMCAKMFVCNSIWFILSYNPLIFQLIPMPYVLTSTDH